MKTVKIGDAEYRAIKALATKSGRLLQYVLTEAIRNYLKANREAKEAEYAGGVR